ncbi:MAG TPA: PQQ-binding-like beta-propeller repeat protein, partial [Gammaproteobacteria bacterium]|nr:PQQ-binding-like beta-propeller repeat protein [Gammaproteobacteria bacterium]
SPAGEPVRAGSPPVDNPLASAVVALDARTGERRWQFQVVHHDLWGYDVAAPPLLVDVPVDGAYVQALALAGETGYAYLFNRATGEPLFPIIETAVPKSEVPGEQGAPAQPVPVKPAALARTSFGPEDLVTARDTSEEHAQFCRELRDRSGGLQNTGPFTPFRYRAPGTEPHSTVVFPGTSGGVGWGGPAADPALGFVFANVTNMGSLGWVEPNAADTTAAQTGEGPRREQLPFRRGSVVGEPHQFAWTAAGGALWPCQRPPWGQLVAINVASGEIAWQVPLGVTADLPEDRQRTGRPNSGGPIATAAGLVFVAASDDRRLRAFDSRTGEELWSAPLPLAAHAVPVTYLGRNGKQYVAVVAGGDTVTDSASPAGNAALIAFSLPQ